MFIDTIFSRPISTTSGGQSRAYRSAWHLALVLSVGLFSTTLVGCGDDDGGIEIAGAYETEYDSTETITDETWTTASVEFGESISPIALYDNAENFAVTQNPADSSHAPGKFNKLVWTEPEANGSFYYCTVDFALDSADEAAASTATADSSDPATSGCGGSFPWTRLFVAPDN